MSMIPANRECPDCFGYIVTGLGGVGSQLDSRCRCGEPRLVDPEDPPELKRESRAGWVK